MRALAYNHFFEQDLDALSSALLPGETLDVVPYQRLFWLARAHFPARAFDTVEGAFAPDLDDSWSRYTPAAARFADWLLRAYQPNVFIVPSDSFFYLRPVIERFQRFGVPTVIVQKETTISPMTMTTHAEVVRRLVPPIGDVMTVCSERHREFEIRCGADPDTVIVTGQPRFDVYAQAVPSGRRGGVPSLLYLSFDDDAYLPDDAERTGLGTWRPMRQEVERVLAELARSGRWHVVAKIHPQQQAIDDELGPAVVRAPRGADTRELILGADAVVGFQTTAVYEAAVAGRPIVYPAWGAVYEAARPLLIPFEDHPGLVTRVADSHALRDLLTRGVDAIDRPSESGRRAAEEHLGPVDGHATERVLTIVREHVARGELTLPTLDRGQRLRALTRGASAFPLDVAGRMACWARLTRVGEPVQRRAAQWRQELHEWSRIRRSRVHP